MKKNILLKRGSVFIAVIILLALLALLISSYLFVNLQCNKSVTYSVGNVDSRFKISSAEVDKILEEAAYRWNQQSGKEVLKKDPASLVKINLVYDQRQADLDLINSMAEGLDQNKSEVENTNNNFNALVSKYQQDLNAYNSKVAKYNSEGGAPQDVYNELQKEKNSLDKRRNELIKMSQSLNVNITNYNSDLKNLQDQVDSRKNLIVTQGVYIPATEEIDIYTFGNKEELRLVLMHELGHALGLGHDQDKQSIMYYLLNDQNMSDPKLTGEDLAMLQDRCSFSNPNLFQRIFKIGQNIN